MHESHLLPCGQVPKMHDSRIRDVDTRQSAKVGAVGEMVMEYQAAFAQIQIHAPGRSITQEVPKSEADSRRRIDHGQMTAVGEKSDLGDVLAEAAAHDMKSLSPGVTAQIPELHAFIHTPREEPVAVRGKGNRANALAVPA